jgi:hypothetical protein
MTDLSERELMQKWMESKIYSREDLLAVVRNNKWRQRKQYTVPKTTIDKKTEIHTIVSYYKKPHGTLEYKQTDGRGSY